MPHLKAEDAHPGDTGMDNIAKLLFEQLNIYLTANDRTIYTTIPESVSISGGNEISTENGKLSLTATVLPEGSSDEILWTVDNKSFAEIDKNGVLTAKNNGVVTVRAASRFSSTVFDEKTIVITGQTEPFALKYDKNTDDEVSNMPNNDEYAKNNYETQRYILSDEKYPLRAKYNFVGWSLTPDGAKIVTEVDIKKDTTVFAIWEDAVSWTFDRSGDTMGIAAKNGFNVRVTDGKYTALATETDEGSGNVLSFVSPELEIDTEKYKWFSLSMQNSVRTDSSVVKLVINTTSGDKTYTQNIASTEKTDYNFDISDASGIITGFQIYPTNIDCSVAIDSVFFSEGVTLKYDKNTEDEVRKMPGDTYSNIISENEPERDGYTFLGWTKEKGSKLLVGKTISVDSIPTTLYAVWDKNDHFEFDSADDYSFKNIAVYSFEDGILTFSGNNTDPNIFPKVGFGYDVSTTSGTLIERVKWSGSGSIANQIFFDTNGTGYSESNSRLKWLSSKADWQTVSLPLNMKGDSETVANPAWNGTLNALRFDITNKTEPVSVDYIRFSDSEANIAVKSGTSRKVTSEDWASYLVADGATVCPVGKTVIEHLYLNGTVDMSNGYLLYKEGNVIGEEAPVAVFELDKDAKISVCGIDFEGKEGESFILPLDADGACYVDTEAGGEVKKYRLTKDDVELISPYTVTVGIDDVEEKAVISADDAEGVIIVAFYNGNRLISVKKSEPQTEINIETYNIDFSTAKIMWWNDFNKITPRCEMVELSK